MAKLKKGKFSPEEDVKLLKIPFGQGRKTKEIEKLSKTLNRPYEAVFRRWTVVSKAAITTNSAVVSVADITPMKFESIDFIDTRASVKEREAESMYKGLDAAIKSGALSTKKALLIDTRFKVKANQHLVKTYPKSVFTFHSYPKDSKRVQIIQKS